MNIRCKHCGEYFGPCEETLDLMAGGYIYADSVNCCDDYLEQEFGKSKGIGDQRS